LLHHPVEAFSQGEVAILGARDFDVATADHFVAHEEEVSPFAIQGDVETGGKQAGFEAGGAEDGLLGDGHALEGEQLLGVDGAVEGD